jgi:hypothetical protein
MSNINVLSTDKNNFRDLSKGISFDADGTRIRIFVSEGFRIFFEQGVPSIFPKNSSGDYSGGGIVVLNFQNGSITGVDEGSLNFTPVIPSTATYVAVTVALNRNSELVVFKGNEGSLADVSSGVLDSSLNYLGNQPIDTIKLFTVLLTSSDGLNLSNISKNLIFSYLNCLNFNVPASRVSYTAFGTTANFLNNEISSTTDTIIKEPFLTDVFSGSNQYQTSRTSVKIGDVIDIERTLNNQVQVTTVTVTNVITGALNDTVEFTPVLTTPHILELKPLARIIAPPVYNLSRGLYQKNRRMVFDSGWITVALGSTGSFSTADQGWVCDPINTKPLIVWNSVKDSNNVIVLSDSFRSDANQRIGVQTNIASSFIRYEIAPSGVFYNLETSQLVTDGFIRIFLREV